MIARAAHGLKGTCRQIGAKEMARICGDIEAVSGSDDLRPAPELLGALASEFERVRAALCIR